MGKDFAICVGMVGAGIWHSPDGGDSWERARLNRYPENAVKALAVHPREPNVLFAGTDSGVYRSENRGATWDGLGRESNSADTWALAIDPVVKGGGMLGQEGGAKVYHQRFLASVNVRASCSGVVSQRQASYRLVSG